MALEIGRRRIGAVPNLDAVTVRPSIKGSIRQCVRGVDNAWRLYPTLSYAARALLEGDGRRAVSLGARTGTRISHGSWAVLTAVILTQMSVGKSVKATIDYALGTLGGAIYAGLIAAFVPRLNDAALAAILAIAIAPVALLAALSPRFAAAPSSAAIVVLAPASHMLRLSRRLPIALSRWRWEARSPWWCRLWCFRRALAS